MSEEIDPSKMKVAELRAELQERGLDTKGNKPVLVERLREALESKSSGKAGHDESLGGQVNEKDGDEEDEDDDEGGSEEADSQPVAETKEPEAQPTPMKRVPGGLSTPRKKVPEAQSTPRKKVLEAQSTPVKKAPEAQPTPAKKAPEAQPTPAKKVPEAQPTPAKKVPEAQPTPAKKVPEAQPTPAKKAPEAQPTPAKKVPEAQPTPAKKAPEAQPTPAKKAPEAQPTPAKKAPEAQPTPAKKAPEAQPTPAKKAPEAQPTPIKKAPEAQPTPAKKAPEAQPTPAKKAPETQSTPTKKVPEAQPTSGKNVADPKPSPAKKVPDSSPAKGKEPGPREAVVKDEPDESSKDGYEEAPEDEVDIKTEQDNGLETEIKEEFDAEVKQEYGTKQEQMDCEETEAVRRGEKRALSRSRSPEAKRSRPDVEELRIEDEPEMDKTVVALDWYNSDLSLIISKEDYLSAQPLTMQGFGYVWHGVRASYGFTHGRIFYEVKVEDYLPVPQLEEEEQHPHVLRCGWSINDAGLTLGEDPFSYGYGGTGKASTNLRFKDYGKMFGKGDIVGCFLDMEAEPIVMSFTVNGEHQGMAYEIHHADLGDHALFPHLVTKNASFRVNFGTEDPWCEPLTGYTFAGHVPLEERVLGSQNPEKREDAEVIMMVGLPAAGKTTWVEQYCKENVEKKYNVLGTNSLIDKMKVNGLPRRRNYAGRWEVLIERCTKCLNKLLELSYKRRRNFIIDQTNVYPSAQRRKMKGFAGFKRRAVVICPTDEDLKKRTEKRESEEGKDVPDKAVLEMKANFKLPEEGGLFDSVEFIELQRDESQKLVEQYNKEGEAAGFGQKKGFRGDFSNRRGNRGSSFRGGWDRDRRGGYNDRREKSSWNRDRDSRDYNRGGYNRESRGSYNRDYNRGGGGGGGGGGYNRESRGSYNRDRGNRTGNYQSNWNRNSSNEIKSTSSSASTTTTTNPWATQQGTQGSQGYGSYGSYGNQGYQGYSYGQGYNNWNQQYYQQPQAQPQQYWGTGYNYGSQSYGTTPQYGTSGTSSQANTTGGSWSQPSSSSSSSWGGTGQQQWGGAYNKQWGSGYGSGSQSSQRR
ncbi:heterogeneous nuclear ribonucleoprotein U-like protein 1 isoform X2 [Procambarus clarkii]|uniref:heterogeneous nuclear ribonucleoprotein U-like protein 1 isoform X2 n=1 Tax=Procambarus clarkii TaxID=6728 RepID=UPI0037448BA3